MLVKPTPLPDSLCRRADGPARDGQAQDIREYQGCQCFRPARYRRDRGASIPLSLGARGGGEGFWRRRPLSHQAHPPTFLGTGGAPPCTPRRGVRPLHPARRRSRACVGASGRFPACPRVRVRGQSLIVCVARSSRISGVFRHGAVTMASQWRHRAVTERQRAVMDRRAVVAEAQRTAAEPRGWKGLVWKRHWHWSHLSSDGRGAGGRFPDAPTQGASLWLAPSPPVCGRVYGATLAQSFAFCK